MLAVILNLSQFRKVVGSNKQLLDVGYQETRKLLMPSYFNERAKSRPSISESGQSD